MGRLVKDFLQLVLGVSLDLFPIGIHKSLGVTQAPAEERLELILGDRDRGIGVISLLVLLLAKTNPVPEEGRGKGDLGRFRSSSSSKIVFILLTEVVVVHVGLSAVYVQGAGF